MSSDQIKALIDRIDKLTKVLAVSAVKDRPSQDQVAILAELGFNQNEISKAIGMSQGNISKVLRKPKSSRSTGQPRKQEGDNA